MDIKTKLTRLKATSPAPPSAPSPPAPLVAEEAAQRPEGESDDIRSHLKKKASRRRAVPSPSPEVVASTAAIERAWPFVEHTNEEGPSHVATRTYEKTWRHGLVRTHAALDVTGDAVARLALDPVLRAFDPATTLFLDTETTGLAGGAGTIPFLVGVAWFEDSLLHVEQHLVTEPGTERPLLVRLGERLRAARSIVTFNGKTFDLPLLRTRFVLERVEVPEALPHLDLLHVARRIYGARVDRCNLATLERDVLGFEREGDIPGEEIPERYLRFLREGDRAALIPVVEHNAWDLIALAALVGELGARITRADADGRIESHDLFGLARTSLRAGDADGAITLAAEAAERGAQEGLSPLCRDAYVFAANIYKKARDAEATRARLLDALEHAPEDPAIHLELARCYEKGLGDPERALEHALRAYDAEEPPTHARRLARLRKSIRARAVVQLSLPGVQVRPERT